MESKEQNKQGQKTLQKQLPLREFKNNSFKGFYSFFIPSQEKKKENNLTIEKRSLRIVDNIEGRVRLNNLRKKLGEKEYEMDSIMKILVWNIRSINTDGNIRQRKLNYLKNTLNKFQPEIVYIIDANYNTLMNLNYHNYFDGRNIVLIRKEICDNVLIDQNSYIIREETNKLVFKYLTPNLEGEIKRQQIKEIIEFMEAGYVIIGDLNINTNKEIGRYIVNKECEAYGEETNQTIMIFPKERKKEYYNCIKKYAPSDHQLILFTINKKYKAKSFMKVLVKLPLEDKQEIITHILQGEKYYYNATIVEKKAIFNTSEMNAFVTVALNAFINNNSHLAHVLLSAKINSNNFIGKLENKKVINEWKVYMGHDENKVYKKIEIENDKDLTNTFNEDIINRLEIRLGPQIWFDFNNKNKRPKPYNVRVKNLIDTNLIRMKKFKSKALNEEQITIKFTSEQVLKNIEEALLDYDEKTYDRGIEEIQNYIRNIIKLNNSCDQNYYKGDTFFLLKNKEVKKENLTRKDTRMIYINPPIMTILESLIYSEVANALDKAIKAKSSFNFGGLKGGSTYAYLYQMVYKTEIYDIKAILISDITTGYDAVDYQILKEFIKKDNLLCDRIKKLTNVWIDITSNLDIWIGDVPVKKTKGIPMGSALSPIIFVYYVTNLFIDFKNNYLLFTYIDDLSKLILFNDNIINVIKNIINCLKNGKMCINLKKTTLLITERFKENAKLKEELEELKNSEYKDINIEFSVKLLGREIRFIENEIVSNDDKFIDILKGDIKCMPKWTPLMIKKVILDAQFTSRVRFIALMLAPNKKELSQILIRKFWKYYVIGTDKLSYSELLFKAWNIFRLTIDIHDVRKLMYKIQVKVKEAYLKYNESADKEEKIQDKLIVHKYKRRNNIFNEVEVKCDVIRDIKENNVVISELDNDLKAIAYTDGSFDSIKCTYGLGAIILLKEKKITMVGVGKHKDYIDKQNVTGELLSVEQVVNFALKKKIKLIKIKYDYVGIENWAVGAWKANTKVTGRYQRFMEDIKRKNKIKIIFEKVKAHAKIAGNEEADKLSKRGTSLEVKDVNNICEVKFKETNNNAFEAIEWNKFDENSREVNKQIAKEDKELEAWFKKTRNKKITSADLVQLEKINNKRNRNRVTWAIKSEKTIREVKSIMKVGIKQIDDIIDRTQLIINDKNLEVEIDTYNWQQIWISQNNFLNDLWYQIKQQCVYDMIDKRIKEGILIEKDRSYTTYILLKVLFNENLVRFNWIVQMAFNHADLDSKQRNVWFKMIKAQVEKLVNFFNKGRYSEILEFNVLDEISQWQELNVKTFITWKKIEYDRQIALLSKIQDLEDYITNQIVQIEDDDEKERKLVKKGEENGLDVDSFYELSKDKKAEVIKREKEHIADIDNEENDINTGPVGNICELVYPKKEKELIIGDKAKKDLLKQDEIYGLKKPKLIFEQKKVKKLVKIVPKKEVLRKGQKNKWILKGRLLNKKEKNKILKRIYRNMKSLYFAVDVIWNKTDSETIERPWDALWFEAFKEMQSYHDIAQIYHFISRQSTEPPLLDADKEEENITWHVDEEQKFWQRLEDKYKYYF